MFLFFESILHWKSLLKLLGRGGGQRARLLRSNPAEVYSFFCKSVFEMKENKQKRGWGWPT